jgi:hypothetical protein
LDDKLYIPFACCFRSLSAVKDQFYSLFSHCSKVFENTVEELKNLKNHSMGDFGTWFAFLPFSARWTKVG